MPSDKLEDNEGGGRGAGARPEVLQLQTTTASRSPRPRDTPSWGAAASPGTSAVLPEARQFLPTAVLCPQTPGVFHFARGTLDDGNGYTSGQMLPFLSAHQKPRASGAPGFSLPPWVSAGAEVPNCWSLFTLGPTVSPKEKGGGWVWAKETRTAQERDPLAHSPEQKPRETENGPALQGYYF